MFFTDKNVYIMLIYISIACIFTVYVTYINCRTWRTMRPGWELDKPAYNINVCGYNILIHIKIHHRAIWNIQYIHIQIWSAIKVYLHISRRWIRDINISLMWYLRPHHSDVNTYISFLYCSLVYTVSEAADQLSSSSSSVFPLAHTHSHTRGVDTNEWTQTHFDLRRFIEARRSAFVSAFYHSFSRLFPRPLPPLARHMTSSVCMWDPCYVTEHHANKTNGCLSLLEFSTQSDTSFVL